MARFPHPVDAGYLVPIVTNGDSTLHVIRRVANWYGRN